MSDDDGTFEQHLAALRELFDEYPDHETVMEKVAERGSVDSISKVSWGKKPKSHFNELYEAIKDDPSLVDRYPETIELATDMVVDRPGLNNQYLKLLVLAILLENPRIVTRIEDRLPALTTRFETISRDFETVMAQYWHLDSSPEHFLSDDNHAQVSTLVSQTEDVPTRSEAELRQFRQGHWDPDQDQDSTNRAEAAHLLDSMVFQAESLGYLLAACSYEFPDQVVPLTPTAFELSQISTRNDEELPEHPTIGNATIKSKSCIPNMSGIFLTEMGSTYAIDDPNPGQVGKFGTVGQSIFSDEIPSGFVDQLVTYHDAYVNSPLAVTKTALAAPLSESHVDLVEPVIPDLLDLLKTPMALTALTNVAKQRPDLLLLYQDDLRELLTEGKELEGNTRTEELEYEREIETILESVSVSQMDEFWDFARIWIDTAEQTSPEVKRAVIDLIREYVETGGSLDGGPELFRTLANDPDWQVRLQVVEILAEDSGGSYRSLLDDLSDDPIPEVQDAAEEALSQD